MRDQQDSDSFESGVSPSSEEQGVGPQEPLQRFRSTASFRLWCFSSDTLTADLRTFETKGDYNALIFTNLKINMSPTGAE